MNATTCRLCRTELGLDDHTGADGRLEALFVLSITLGLRPGELRKLSWDHVGLDKGVIHVCRSASRTGEVKTPNVMDTVFGDETEHENGAADVAAAP